MKTKVNRIVKKIGAKILGHNSKTAIVEAVLDQHKVKELLDALNPIGIKELVRTGRIAIEHH